MQDLLVRSAGDAFLVGERQIPKHNHRQLSFSQAQITDDRQLELSVSSDIPYQRSWYYEVLEHSAEAVDLSRFNDGAMALFNHNRDDYIGVIERAWLKNGKLYNILRFDTHELAERILQSINNNIIRNVSIGYVISDLELIKKTDDGCNVYKATRWTPYETSIVCVPADASVGVGRSYYPLSFTQVKQSSVNWENSGKEKTRSEKKDMPEAATVEIDEKDIRQQERDRIGGITALGTKYGYQDLAQRAIDGDMTIEQARSLFADKILTRSEEEKPIASPVKPVGMSKKERLKYSVIRAIGYAAGLIPKEKVGLELEVSKTLQERIGKAPKKIYIDQSELVSYRAPYETGVPAAAGDLIETELLSDRFIEQLYNMAAVLDMGVTYLRDLTGNIEIPRESTYTNGYWVGEKNTIPEEEGTFDKISLSPNKLAVLTKMTFEMMEQASIDLERLVRARLIRGLALELDRTILFGSGISNEPLGIASHPEVKSIDLGANGGALDWSGIVDMQTELAAGNAMNGGTCGYIINARTRGKLMKTLDQTTGGGSWIYRSTGTNQGEIAGYRTNCSNQIPNNLVKGTATDLTAVFFGDFSNVLLGIWSGMDVMANPYSEFSEAIIQVRAMQLVDHNLTRGDYFCVATDVQNN